MSSLIICAMHSYWLYLHSRSACGHLDLPEDKLWTFHLTNGKMPLTGWINVFDIHRLSGLPCLQSYLWTAMNDPDTNATID